MQMMRPLRRRIMCGTAARVHRNVGRRFRRSTKSQSSTFISQILALRLPPTSFTRMSMHPKRSTHVAISRLAGASSLRSPATATAAPPAAVIAAAVLSSPAASRSPSATRAPSRASSSAISRANARMIVEAIDLPVSADFEKCFGDAPAVVAETIRLAADVGLVGGSVEDATGEKDRPLYDIGQATKRVAAAAQAARALPFPFMLTARTESFLRGNPNLDDVIKRLQAFETAGPDVLMAPGLPDLAAVRGVCAAVSKPVNFMAGIKGKSFTVAELEAAGVRRIRLATSLYRYAMTNLRQAAREVKDKGTFGYIDRSIPSPDLAALMQG